MSNITRVVITLDTREWDRPVASSFLKVGWLALVFDQVLKDYRLCGFSKYFSIESIDIISEVAILYN